VAALVRRLGIVAVVVAVALFALSLGRGEPWTRALLGAVSLAMAAIPEEFPIVLTLFLSVGALEEPPSLRAFQMVRSVERLAATLKARRYPSLECSLRLFSEETHGSVVGPGLVRGLRETFGPGSKVQT